MTHRATPRSEAVEYPTRDGKPMAESDEHGVETQAFALGVLRAHFAADPNVYVSGNNFVYYVQGVPRAVVSPDVYVVHGARAHLRDSYKVWEEGGLVPRFVLEITSKSTHREDTGDKLAKYRDGLRVPEYFLFDLRGDWIPERLRGLTLDGGDYRPIEVNDAGRLPSRALGLELGVRDGHLRFFVPGAREPLPTHCEAKEREREAKERALAGELREREAKEHALAGELREREAKERALAGELRARQEAERLRAELERLRGPRPLGP